MGSRWTTARELLLWVRTGRARVSLASGREFDLSEGEGIWVAAAQRRSVRTEPGSVAVPLLLSARREASSVAARRFAVPTAWRDWLLHCLCQQIAPTTSIAATDAATLPRIGIPATGPVHRGARDLIAPPLPAEGIAAEIAEQILFDPGLRYTVAQWARRTASSPRVIRREFRRATGMTFERWRADARLAAAAERLAAGDPVATVAHRCGFASRSGFARAFRLRTGVCPSDYGPSVRRGPAAGTAIRGAIERLIAGGPPPGTGPAVPPTFTRQIVNGFSVLVWVYRGQAQVRVGRRWHTLQRGDAIWLPRGVENQTVVNEGSMLLPVGAIERIPYAPEEPLRTHFPREYDDRLVYEMVARYTMLRPPRHHERVVRELFEERALAHLLRAIPLPVEQTARAAAITAVTALMRGDHAPVDDAGLTVALSAELGISRRSWEHTIRMRLGADLLASGLAVGDVARRLGYSHPHNFTRALTRFTNSAEVTHEQFAN